MGNPGFFVWLTVLLTTAGLTSGCMSAYVKSVGGETEQVFSRIFLTDYDTAWIAVLEALKSSPLEITNKEGGFLRTKWIENTAQKNLKEYYGPAATFVKAQYRVRVSVGKGFYDGKPSVRVVVQKDQFVQYDALDGFKPVVSDSVEENTLLYRIGRIILIRLKLAKLDEARARSEINANKLKNADLEDKELDGLDGGDFSKPGDDPDFDETK